MATYKVDSSNGDAVSTAAYDYYDTALVVDGSIEHIAWGVGVDSTNVSGSGGTDGGSDSSDPSLVE